MKYKLYQLVEPDHLSVQVEEGYHQKTIYRSILEEVNGFYDFETEFGSIEQAYEYIEANSEHFKNMDLTVLPILSINWDGNIS